MRMVRENNLMLKIMGMYTPILVCLRKYVPTSGFSSADERFMTWVIISIIIAVTSRPLLQTREVSNIVPACASSERAVRIFGVEKTTRV